MRKTLVSLLAILSIACFPMESHAAKDGEKGPSDRAYEHASDNASFKREGGKPGKGEHADDHDHDLDSDDSGFKWPWQKNSGDSEDSDSDDHKSGKKDDDDKDDHDSDDEIKSADKVEKKGGKEKKNKK